LILAMKVLKDMLMHGEIFVPAQNVAIAIDLNVDVLTIMIEKERLCHILKKKQEYF